MRTSIQLILSKMRTSIQLILIFFLVFVAQLTLIAAQPVLACSNCNDTNGNYTSNSAYSKNLNILLNTISSNTQIQNGFYNFSIGEDPDRVYGMAVCRADHSPAKCQSCLSDASQRLRYNCPVQKEAIGYYYGSCMLRYSDRPIFKFLDNSPNCTVQQAPQNIPNPVLTKLKESLSHLLEGLKHSASAGNSSYKFSSGEREITDQLSLYALAQCNPYLSALECSDCLGRVMNNLQQCCSTLNGVGSYGLICSVAFGNYPLLDVATNSSQQPSLPQAAEHSGGSGAKAGNNRSHAFKITIIVLGVVAFMLFGILTILAFSRRKMRKKLKEDEGNGEVKLEDTLQLDFSSIQFATDNFSDANRLGKGSPCAMYKGVLPDGQEIAVKRFNKSGRDGDMEFDNEVLLSANLQHKNLVKLLGFCNEKDQRVLVYEYLPNGNLHDILNDPVKQASLDWQTRYHIIRGLARGLLYLHEDSQVRVIHRDLKPSNILLGDQMDSKISNFRTASLNGADQTRADTRVVGTYGYMPTEYMRHGYFSVKSDVFSYGVMVLEIITGHLINGFSDGEKEESLLTWAWRKWFDGTVLDMVDEALPDIEIDVKQIKRCIEIGLLCVQEDPRQRPMMSTVMLMLNSDTVVVTDPVRQPPLNLNNMDHHTESTSIETDKSHETSLNGLSVSYLDPR